MTDPGDTSTGTGLLSPPWQLTGTAWFGWFPAADPWQPPEPFAPVGGGRGAVVSVFRFDGDPSYDEMTIASPVRSGARIAMFARQCWVSDPRVAQMKGACWGIDAGVAQFTWTAERVEVDADGEKLAGLRLPSPRGRFALPVSGLPAPGFVRKDGQPAVVRSTLRGRVARAAMALEESAGLPAFARHHTGSGIFVRIARLTLPPIAPAPGSPR